MCDRSSCSWSVTKIIEEVSRVYRDRRKFSLVILFSIDASPLLRNFLVPSPMLGLRNSDDSSWNSRWAPANHPSSSSSFLFVRRYRVSSVQSEIAPTTRVRTFRMDVFCESLKRFHFRDEKNFPSLSSYDST